jgi:hypothetical protein
MCQTNLFAVVIEPVHDLLKYEQGSKASHPAAVQRQQAIPGAIHGLPKEDQPNE